MSLTSKKFPADLMLEEALQKRASNNLLRQLRINKGLVDFCSNDYLGFARSSSLKKKVDSFKIKKNTSLNGSGGSRLLSGNSQLAEDEQPTIIPQSRHMLNIAEESETLKRCKKMPIFNSQYAITLLPLRGV